MDLKFEWTKIILAIEIGYLSTDFNRAFGFPAAICFFSLYIAFLVILHA